MDSPGSVTPLRTPVLVELTRGVDVNRATGAAKAFANATGFSLPECEHIALAVSELASNLVRHAGGGAIRIARNAVP
jgi:anti-sigma regulatory factor (Ser/Thr protein kinase)